MEQFDLSQPDFGEVPNVIPNDNTQTMEVPRREVFELNRRAVVDICFSEVRRGDHVFYTCKCCAKQDFRRDSRRKHLETHLKTMESNQFIQVSNRL